MTKYAKLEKEIVKFQQHLAEYQKRGDKKHADLKEISIKGLQKQEEVVRKHYEQYMKTHSPQDFSALENDLDNLLEHLTEHDR